MEPTHQLLFLIMYIPKSTRTLHVTSMQCSINHATWFNMLKMHENLHKSSKNRKPMWRYLWLFDPGTHQVFDAHSPQLQNNFRTRPTKAHWVNQGIVTIIGLIYPNCALSVLVKVCEWCRKTQSHGIKTSLMVNRQKKINPRQRVEPANLWREWLTL